MPSYTEVTNSKDITYDHGYTTILIPNDFNSMDITWPAEKMPGGSYNIFHVSVQQICHNHATGMHTVGVKVNADNTEIYVKIRKSCKLGRMALFGAMMFDIADNALEIPFVNCAHSTKC